MPSFEASEKNIEKLAKRQVSEQDLEFAKAELESREDGILKVKAGDTNRPDLWSEEGIARLVRGIHGARGVPRLAAKKGMKKIVVGSHAQHVRPFISGFIADGVDVTDEMLRSMINVQENLSENFGRKRRQIAIGIYSRKKMAFPLKYDAVEPDSVRFAPLGFAEKMTPKEILQKHPVGVKYANLLSGAGRYPLLTDAKGEVLSLPPVINSNTLGKVEPGEASLFVEVTGPDQRQVMLAANILAQMLFDNGAKLEEVATSYPHKTPLGRLVAAPDTAARKMSFQFSEIEKLLGIRLKKDEAVALLERMQYNAKVTGQKVSVEIPCYRADIMHPVDVIEDIAIAYGYNRFEPLGMKSFTVGSLDRMTVFSGRLRSVMAGLGFQEIISPILTSRESSENMGMKEEMIEIENPMTATYSAVRSSILPCLMGCLARNKNVEYPQAVFESGECCLGIMAKDIMKLGACITNAKVSYEDISSVLDALLRSLELEYKIRPANDPRFIEGRSGTINIGGDKIGVVGEIHPRTLNNWGVENPVVAFELNVSKLMEHKKF
jgi:phenylalanyl-tRNA synthetase beta chain